MGAEHPMLDEWDDLAALAALSEGEAQAAPELAALAEIEAEWLAAADLPNLPG